jgi:hypothetical protein
MGREKLKGGRTRREPPMEYSEFRDGERAWVWTNGGIGDCGMDTPLLDDNVLCWENDEAPVDALRSSSELFPGTDRILPA